MSIEPSKIESPAGQTIYINQVAPVPSNAIGTSGFVFSILAIFLGWIPFIGWIIWLLGLIFSAIGITRQPKGLAISGLVISLIGVVILIGFLGLLIGIHGL